MEDIWVCIFEVILGCMESFKKSKKSLVSQKKEARLFYVDFPW